MRPNVTDQSGVIERYVIRAEISRIPELKRIVYGYLATTSPEPVFVGEADMAYKFTQVAWAKNVCRALGPQYEICPLFMELGDPILGDEEQPSTIVRATEVPPLKVAQG